MKRLIWTRGRWAWLFILLEILTILGASMAKADGFDPSPLFPQESVFFLQLDFPVAQDTITWEINVLDVSDAGADFWGFCIDPHAYALTNGIANAFCSTDGPQSAFEPTGKPFPFDIATDVFGYDPGINPPHDSEPLQASLAITTPEPPAWLMLLPVGLLVGLKRLLWKG